MFQKDVEEFKEKLSQLTEEKIPWYEKYVSLAQLCHLAYLEFVKCLPSIYRPAEKNIAMLITPDVHKAMTDFIANKDSSYESDGSYYLAKIGYREISDWPDKLNEISEKQSNCWARFIDCLDEAKRISQLNTINVNENWNLISKENSPSLIWSLRDLDLDDTTRELIDNCRVSNKKDWPRQLNDMNSTSPLYPVKKFVSRTWTNFESGEVCPYNFNFILSFTDNNRVVRRFCFVYSMGIVLHSVHNSWAFLGKLVPGYQVESYLNRIPVNK